MTLRLIAGGRDAPKLPGLLVVGAAEIVTMAGGPRMGSEQAAVGRLTADDMGGPAMADAPAIAIWEGRILGVGGLSDLDRALGAEGYP
ncbi:MAG: hypothetical protein M3Q66_06390, partial [Chloroflexota bacterium]|nr:hypothetical protein [Chloroflexota bacterium]